MVDKDLPSDLSGESAREEAPEDFETDEGPEDITEARAECLSDIFFLLSDRTNYEQRLLSCGPLRQMTDNNEELYLDGWLKYIDFEYASVLLWLTFEDVESDLVAQTQELFKEKIADEHPNAEEVVHELETEALQNLTSFQQLLSFLHGQSDKEVENRLEQEPTHPAVDLFFASDEMLPLEEKQRVHETMVRLSLFNKYAINRVLNTDDPDDLRPTEIIQEVDEKVTEEFRTADSGGPEEEAEEDEE